MSIGRLFNLCMVVAMLIVVVVAGQALLREAADYRGRVRAIDAEIALETSMRVMERLARERGPTFLLLSRTAAATANELRPLFAERNATAEAVVELRNRIKLLSDSSNIPKTAALDVIHRSIDAIDEARAAIHIPLNAGLALPQAERDPALTRNYADADLELQKHFVPLLNALQARVAMGAPEAASVIQIARYAANLRHLGGIQASLLTAVIAERRPVTSEELLSVRGLQGGIDQLRSEIDAGIGYVGNPPALVEAWRLAGAGYFTRGRAIIDQTLDTVGDRFPIPLADFITRMTTELRNLFGLREAATTTAIDMASRGRDAAWRSVQASGAEMFVVVAAVCGLTFWFRRKVVQPMTGLAAKIEALAGGERDIEIEMTERRDEVGGLARATRVFYDALIEREQLAAELKLEMAGRIKSEAARADMQEQLLQSKKMESIGTMAGGVAHELNNLLQPILMLAECLADQLPEQDQDSREDMATIIDHAERARHIVGSIVTFVRKKTVDPAALDVAQEMRGAEALLRSLVPTTVNIERHISAGPCPVMANRTELMQVVSNLVINASHAMNKSGSVQITLEKTTITEGEAAQLQVSPGDYAELSVSDTGSGIEPGLLDRIFEPFFTTKPAGQGTGLGLSVAYGIVRAWKGAMRVRSEVGRGTKISVLVPMLPPDSG